MWPRQVSVCYEKCIEHLYLHINLSEQHRLLTAGPMYIGIQH
jgi:hypothetical protein